MNNFLSNAIVQSITKDIDKSAEKNPIDAILKNPLVRSFLKSYRKEILEFLVKGEQDLIRTIERNELQPGETQIAPLIDIDTDDEGRKEIRLIVAAFENTELTRVVTDIPLREYLINKLNEKLK
jgi:hypothetical protein